MIFTRILVLTLDDSLLVDGSPWLARSACVGGYRSSPGRTATTETMMGSLLSLLCPVGNNRACLAVVSSQASAPGVFCHPRSPRFVYMTASVGSPSAYGVNSCNPGNPCGTRRKRGTYWLYRNAFPRISPGTLGDLIDARQTYCTWMR